ncbi:putative PE-PGRS family protein PE_PGRS24 [Mycobacterium innocens]|uniref:Putative PE-PGRS family protein PE_PGRS24 n=1 Tax=Mycobacterium innocens TaxID=2341083 RepID=A0A498QEG5_9MYCO|nr:putative PE-PGRS family protein PE_PGRS24 [Mycobacterium innocens]
MSFVTASSELMASAATDLTSIGSSITQANAAATVLTAGALAAGADEVSAAIAALFGVHAQAYVKR